MWFYDEDFVVVLADRGRYVLLWIAYCTDIKSQREKLMKERERYLEMQKPP